MTPLANNTVTTVFFKPQVLSQMTRFKLVGERIKMRLKQKNLTPLEFAASMKKSQSEISKWLSGQHNFTVETLFDIEDKLEFRIIDIGLPEKLPNVRVKKFGRIVSVDNTNRIVKPPEFKSIGTGKKIIVDTVKGTVRLEKV